MATFAHGIGNTRSVVMPADVEHHSQVSVACLLPLGATPNAARALLVQDAIDMYYGADLLPPVRFDLALSLNNDGETRNTALYKENTHPNVAGNEVMRQRAILDLPELFE